MSQSKKRLNMSSQVAPHLSPTSRDPVMPQLQFKPAQNFWKRQRSGMTMIELLIAISILVIIAAILVPQLRLASADRNLREASRTVASLFAQASQRAINDGEAGVVIERNPNIIDDATGVAYAGTSMFILRKIPRYIGEEGDQAERVREESLDFSDDPNDPMVDDNDIYIPLPLEQELLRTVRVDDVITFNDQPNIRFFITSVDEEEDVVDEETKLRLGLRSASEEFMSFKSIFPDPEPTEQSGGAGDGKSQKVIGSFTIYRQPRKLVSSRIDMPSGYLVDLRVSGEVDGATGAAFFGLDDRDPTTVAEELVPSSVTYLFNGRGSLDRYFYTALVSGSYQRQFRPPIQPAYLMVREYSTDDGGETINNVVADDSTMWVTVDSVSGAANVIPGVPVQVDPDNPPPLGATLQAARTLISQGQAAAQ